MTRMYAAIAAMALIQLLAPPVAGQAPPVDLALVKDVLKKLNSHNSVAGAQDAKSYKILFDAYLELTKPPFEVGPGFNLSTIHPKMESWSAVSGWAESNAKMGQAIIKCKDPKITKVGLPYGREGVDPAYIKAGIVADVGHTGSLGNIDFPYQHAVNVIAAFSTAEVYRLMEAGKVQEALDLSMATAFVLRQFCDRDFQAEKSHSIELLSDHMSNMRDVFYTYFEKISAEQFTKLSFLEIPFLRPERDRLFMPEADKVVAEALINELFSSATGDADPDKFTQAFAGIQSKHAPLTRFGAAKRWRFIASIHGSVDASHERLKLIYDDWWRRWRIDAYDPILAAETQFESTNPIRYAAIVYSVQDVESVFDMRNQLVAEVNGAAMAAGICAYKRTLGSYPDQTEKTYTQFTRKRSDTDPFDRELRPFKLRLVTKRQSVDTPDGRLWIEPGECVLYGLGQDHVDNLAESHTDDGAAGDVVLWPPIKAMSRNAGLIP